MVGSRVRDVLVWEVAIKSFYHSKVSYTEWKVRDGRQIFGNFCEYQGHSSVLHAPDQLGVAQTLGTKWVANLNLHDIIDWFSSVQGPKYIQ